jgi:hypothetical protein
MVRQTLAVCSVFAGNDCGWKPPAGQGRGSDDMPWLEPAVGACLLLAALPRAMDLWSIALILPIVLPLLAAPLITQWLDMRPGEWPSWRPQVGPETIAAAVPAAAAGPAR